MITTDTTTTNATARELGEAQEKQTVAEKIKALLALYPGGMTADEIAAHIGEDRLTVRPEVTRLIRRDWLYDTGLRRKNTSGKTARVIAMWPLLITYVNQYNTHRQSQETRH